MPIPTTLRDACIAAGVLAPDAPLDGPTLRRLFWSGLLPPDPAVTYMRANWPEESPGEDEPPRAPEAPTPSVPWRDVIYERQHGDPPDYPGVRLSRPVRVY